MSLTEIKTIVEEQISKIQPIMTAHGGGVEILEISEKKILLGLKGHCAGCPMASVTFGIVLKKHITNALPEMKEVTFVDIALVNKILHEHTIASIG